MLNASKSKCCGWASLVLLVAARWSSKYSDRRLRRSSAFSVGSYSLIGPDCLGLSTFLEDNARLNSCRRGFCTGMAGGPRSLFALHILPPVLINVASLVPPTTTPASRILFVVLCLRPLILFGAIASVGCGRRDGGLPRRRRSNQGICVRQNWLRMFEIYSRPERARL